MTEDLEERFRKELAAWRQQHPGWTSQQQLQAFTPTRLYYEYADQDGPLYVRLMEIAGYLISKERS